MADMSIEDNPNKDEVVEDPFSDNGLMNKELELPVGSPPDQLLDASATDGGISDPFADISNSSTPLGMDADIGNVELGGKPLDLPNEINVDMETPSISDSIGLADAIPNSTKSRTANPTLGNEVLDMDTIRNIKVNVQAVLGGISMSVSKLSNLKEGELVSLEKTIGEEIEILANGQLIARGEIVVIEGDVPKFGITITSIVGS